VGEINLCKTQHSLEGDFALHMCRRDALVAIDWILTAYGPTLSVTEFIDQIQKDSKTGGHPALQI